MDEDKIKYSDIIQPDSSITELIKQLSDLNKTYASVVTTIKDGADRIIQTLKSTSSSTNENRKQIDDATIAANRLDRAYKELQFSISDTGKKVAWLKAQTADNNKATVEQQRYLKTAITSYDRIKADLKETVKLYKSLTDAERDNSEMGEKLLSEILTYKAQLASLDDKMKLHIQTVSALEKAKQKLAYLQSEEGKQYLAIQNQIRAEIAANKEKKAQLTELEKAKQRLIFAQSAENEQLKLYNLQANEANEIAKLKVIIANNEEGSYNRLSAQYALNKIQLNKMSAEQRSATQSGQELEKQTNEIYQQMIKLQEATGNYRLSVGNYKTAWNGLGVAVNQVVRELPAAAISLNTFFLGISNNIPMLVDEINKLRKANERLIAQGKPAKSVIGGITKAIFSWNTVLIIGLTVLASHGEAIVNWIGQMLKGTDTTLSHIDALKNLNKELEKGTGEYGKNRVSLKKLTDQWKSLTSEKDKLKFIKDNQKAFEDLGVAVKSVADADLLFLKSTPAVIEALGLRAKAAAAQALATEKYQEAFVKINKATLKLKEGPSFLEKLIDPLSFFFDEDSKFTSILPNFINLFRSTNLAKEAIAAEKAGDTYQKMWEDFSKQANNVLKNAGLSPFIIGLDSEKKGRTPRDPEDTLESLSLAATKAYQESITELEREEIEKRRKQTVEAYNVEVAELNKKYNKIQRILDGEDERYKKLTDEQKEQALKAQDDILRAIQNIQEKSKVDLSNLTYAEQEHALNNMLATTELQMQAAKEGSEEEIRLRLRLLEIERQIAIARNKQLPPSEQQSESDINASFNKQRTGVVTDYNMSAFDQQQALNEAEFNAVRHTEDEITKFKLQQERDRWVQQIALAKAGALDWGDVQIKAAEATVTGIDRKLAELDDFIIKVGEKGISGAILSKMGFDNKAISAFDSAVDTVISNLQEIAQAEVDLAQAAVDAAAERVDAAQSAYEAELEARNNGYANSIASARRELQQEKKRQQEKQKILEEAQRRQQAIDTVVQTSSLITASANIWASMSKAGIIGPVLALAAIAAMWTSFAAAKIKARQVTASSSEEYGEGGLEVLEGGSHASGNDIDLGVNNKRKKRMKAEGGEALAIINKRNTAKYKRILPDVISSLNKGIFEDKFTNAFAQVDSSNLVLNSTSTDLSRLEAAVDEIVKQNKKKYVVKPDGSLIEIDGNTIRVIKK